jgi:hypothetical protein
VSGLADPHAAYLSVPLRVYTPNWYSQHACACPFSLSLCSSSYPRVCLSLCRSVADARALGLGLIGRDSTSGVPFDAVPAAVVVPPYTAAMTVQLSGRARGAGQLSLQGVRIGMFGVEREHRGTVTSAAPAAPAAPAPDGRRHVTSAASAPTNATAAATTAAMTTMGVAGAVAPEADGVGGEAKPLGLTVIEELPQLHVHDTHLFATPLQLWEGERYVWPACVLCVGSIYLSACACACACVQCADGED